MKAFQVQTDGGVDAIRLVDLPEPHYGKRDVLIRVRAASLNYRDLGVTSGGYYRNDTRPVVALSDGAGEVIAVGTEVTRWKPGDRVSPTFVRNWIDGQPNDAMLRTCLGGGIDGVLAEFIAIPEQSLVAIPDCFTFAEAATVPCAAVTVWHALFESGNLKPGETVLLLGTGGVSIFALQMAKAAGASVIITSSSDEKLQLAKSLGADEAINYQEHPDWNKEVLRLTHGEGVDHVVEVGGPGTLERSLKSSRVGGYIHLIGVLDSPSAKISPMLGVFNLLKIHGIYVGSRRMHEQTIRFMERKQIKPIIDQTFHFDDAIEAYHYFASQRHVGKVVIQW